MEYGLGSDLRNRLGIRGAGEGAAGRQTLPGVAGDQCVPSHLDGSMRRRKRGN